jgi:hypothetical protein
MNKEENVLVQKKGKCERHGIIGDLPVQFFFPEARNTDKLADNGTGIHQSSRREKSENDG